MGTVSSREPGGSPLKGAVALSVQYADRSEAGRVLAGALQSYTTRSDNLVLALPRGGIVVAYEIAKSLGCPLDVMTVGRLGLPDGPDLGVVTAAGPCVINRAVVNELGIPEDAVALARRNAIERAGWRELDLRGDRTPPRLQARSVILVDDGVATGATMRSAIAAARAQRASLITVATPVGSAPAIAELCYEADEVVCPATPGEFVAISQFYDDFPVVDDDLVRELLHAAWAEREPTSGERVNPHARRRNPPPTRD